MIYYISDIHFRDDNVFKKCSRNFTFGEYEKMIVSKWNSKVKEDDEVYILGDVAENDVDEILCIIKTLKGKKHLIIGNHDENFLKQYQLSNLFETIDFIKLIIDNGRKVCLCHYPLMDWVEFNRQGILVYGHIHNKTVKNGPAYAEIKDYYKDKPAYNAGVDVTGFEPRTLDELIVLKEANKDEPYIN